VHTESPGNPGLSWKPGQTATASRESVSTRIGWMSNFGFWAIIASVLEADRPATLPIEA
jgi:hypothetical protein